MNRMTRLEIGLTALLFALFFAIIFAVADCDRAEHDLSEAQKRVEVLNAQLAYLNEHPYVLVIEEPSSKQQNVTTSKISVTAHKIEKTATKQANNATVCKLQSSKTDDVSLLARLIMCEIGSDGHPDEQLYNVGSVVINRINDPRFPNTLRGVIYQAGQYGPAITGIIESAKPTQRCYDIAADLLANGSRLPADVVWQSGVTQGTEVYAAYTSPVTGTTTYYCR